MLRLPLALALGARLTTAFDNGAPHSRLPGAYAIAKAGGRTLKLFLTHVRVLN